MKKKNKVPKVKVKKSFSFSSFFLKVFMFLFIIGIGMGAYLIYTVSKETPVDLIDGYAPVSPSVIYDINGNQIDTIMVQNRSPIGIGEIPEHVQNAFLAIEDRKFRTHYGFDFIRTARAAFLTLTKTRR